jgi:hypothetical protein
MKALILSLLIVSPVALSEVQPYFKVGAGYKLSGTVINHYHQYPQTMGPHLPQVYSDSPVSAKIELGVKWNNWTFGLSHASQWTEGKPFNNKNEYSRNEVFVDYTFYFWGQ